MNYVGPELHYAGSPLTDLGPLLNYVGPHLDYLGSLFDYLDPSLKATTVTALLKAGLHATTARLYVVMQDVLLTTC